MISVPDAFEKFRGRLEVSPTDEQAASRRQQRLRSELDAALAIEEDFLTGAYARETKTKPLRDVDIMIVLTDRTLLSQHPRGVLDTVTDVLLPIYGDDRVCPDQHAVRVDFGVDVVDDVAGDVVSFDIVPAFRDGDGYLIPDDKHGEWVPTNPRVHKEKATAANKDFDKQWKPLVKMIKKWNETQGRPVEPSFLIETMALDIIRGTWTGSHPREIREFLATAADRISEPWPDPAGLGPDVNNELLADTAALANAQRALASAEAKCTEALRLDRSGRTGDALSTWQGLFGPLFAKS